MDGNGIDGASSVWGGQANTEDSAFSEGIESEMRDHPRQSSEESAPSPPTAHYNDDSAPDKEDAKSLEQLHSKIYVSAPVSVQQSEALVPTSLEDAVGREKTSALRKEAKTMQEGLSAILERIHEVKGDYERLEDENKFLQDYIGNLMSKSKMLTTRSSDS